MPRPRHKRWICRGPSVTGFDPVGTRQRGVVTLNVDEYEAVRLKDEVGIDQKEAALKMQISQPTFHRLLESARAKLAEVIVHGKALRIEGGEDFSFCRGRQRCGWRRHRLCREPEREKADAGRRRRRG